MNSNQNSSKLIFETNLTNKYQRTVIFKSKKKKY